MANFVYLKLTVAAVASIFLFGFVDVGSQLLTTAAAATNNDILDYIVAIENDCYGEPVCVNSTANETVSFAQAAR